MAWACKNRWSKDNKEVIGRQTRQWEERRKKGKPGLR
jgi:hypothetical protein